MDGSTSKLQAMKPLLVKAGIPLAISVAGFICARILSVKTQHSNAIESSEELREDETQMESVSENVEYEQEISELRGQVEELRNKEMEIRTEFARYHGLKEQEFVLKELKNMLLLETAYVEVLNREISSIETENKMLNALAVEYLKMLEQLQLCKSENGLLARKVKKLLKKTKQQTLIIRDKSLKLGAREAELVRSNETIERQSNAIKELEDEVRNLQAVIEQKSDNKLETVEVEDEGLTVEDYKKLVIEYEKLEKERATEVQELINLRWSNACLKHELKRNEAEENEEKRSIFESVGFEENHLDVENHGSSHGGCSKRQKLLKKLKRWVDGSEKEKHEINKCFGKHSASDDDEHVNVIQARKSCSSA